MRRTREPFRAGSNLGHGVSSTARLYSRSLLLYRAMDHCCLPKPLITGHKSTSELRAPLLQVSWSSNSNDATLEVNQKALSGCWRPHRSLIYE